jgi:hypothetical protein
MMSPLKSVCHYTTWTISIKMKKKYDRKILHTIFTPQKTQGMRTIEHCISKLQVNSKQQLIIYFKLAAASILGTAQL